MKILQVFNQLRSLHGGEENVVHTIIDLMEKRGIQCRLVLKSSRGLDRSLKEKVRAFWSGIYSRSAYKEMIKLIELEQPNVVHVHNLFPLFSPSVLIACRKKGIPTVMTVHNLALTCPNWYHLFNANVCEKCLGGHEYWCVLKNCRKNIFESIGYALRNTISRKFRLFHDNVTQFIALSEFSKNRLIDADFQKEKIVIIPNMVSIPDSSIDPTEGDYVAFAGRISPEKGLDTLISAAVTLPKISIRIAGDGPIKKDLIMKSPKNVEFEGLLDTQKMTLFFRKARLLVLPSRCFEMCPLVISEAMSHGLPVIATNIGGIPELVEDGVTGLLFEPSNTEDLIDKLKLLWNNPDMCRKMGKAGREKAIREYNEDIYYQRLVAVYKKVIEKNPK